jgi:putative transposase
VLADRKHVQLPRIGVLKTHESTRKLARRLEQGSARVLAATISRQADRWFVSFTVEVERHPGQQRKDDRGRRGRRHPPSGDPLHRSNDPQPASVGTLPAEAPPTQPAARPRQARLEPQEDHPTEAGPSLVRHRGGELRRQLAYKSAWYGSQLVVADRFYPSSKTCSACGWVKPSSPWPSAPSPARSADRPGSQRRLQPRQARTARRPEWLETQKARGANRRPQPAGQVAEKREAGTERASGKTGTAAPQGAAASTGEHSFERSPLG